MTVNNISLTIVPAGAGSGKTHYLARRMKKSLINIVLISIEQNL